MGFDMAIFVCLVACTVSTIYVACLPASNCQKWLLVIHMCGIMLGTFAFYGMHFKEAEVCLSMWNMAYAMKCLVVIAYSRFICEFCNRKLNKLERVIPVVLLFMSCILVTSNSRTEVMYTYIEMRKGWGGIYPHKVYHLSYFICSGLILVYMIYILVSLLATKPSADRKRNISMGYVIGAGVIPVIFCLVKILFFHNQPDFTTVGVFIALGALGLACRTNGLMDNRMLTMEELLRTQENGILMVDVDGNIVYANDLIAKRFHRIYNLNEAEKKELDALMSQKYSLTRYAGNNFTVRVKEVYDGDLYRGKVATFISTSEEERHFEEMAQLKEQAECAMHARNQFLANISHELKTPMNAILGFSKILSEKECSVEIKEYIADIRLAAVELNRKLDQILTVSEDKVEDCQSISFTVEELVDQIIRDNIYAADKKYIRLGSVKEFDAGLEVVGPRRVIKEVIDQLVDNSIKFTEQGYVNILVDCSKDEEILKISVVDTGRGISAEFLDKMFDPFSAEEIDPNRKEEGLGLGLAGIKRTIHHIGGNITASSEMGKGTRVDVIFPIEIKDL